MSPAEQTAPVSRPARPALEVADILRAHQEEFLRRCTVSPVQRKALEAIGKCRTAALGGHLEWCGQCNYQRNAYNSCRNRHCPKCQGRAQKEWLERRREVVLPVSHFHVVFTLPEQLRALALHNQRKLYGLLFTAATQTVQALSRDPKYLDAELGITAVLHTWSRTLAYHPHLHCLVTAGGLSWDQQRWVDSRQKGRYLFPVKPMGRLFRGKFLLALRELYEQGSLHFGGAAASWQEAPAFETLLQSLRTQDWVVYAKRPMGGAEQVYAYLGRYTHRVGLSNHRLREVTATSVRFTTKGGQQCTLAPVEFIRRLLLHVLPAGFVKIRHYGLLAASHIKSKLERARSLLLAAAVQPAAGRGAQEASAAGTPAISATANPSQGRTEAAPGVVEQRQAEQEREPARCPRCGQAAVYRVPLSWAECPSMLLSLLHRTVLPWLRARDSC